MQKVEILQRETPQGDLLYVPAAAIAPSTAPLRDASIPAHCLLSRRREDTTLSKSALAGIVLTALIVLAAGTLAVYFTVTRRGQMCCWKVLRTQHSAVLSLKVQFPVPAFLYLP